MLPQNSETIRDSELKKKPPFPIATSVECCHTAPMLRFARALRMSEYASSMNEAAAAPIQLVPGNSLITKTPEDGRLLAVKMARLIIKATQPDAAVREKLRAVYAEDAAMLIAIGQTVATEFATIAAANNYWK